MKTINELFNIHITNVESLDGDINYSNIKYSLEDIDGKKYVLKIFPNKEECILAKEESRILNEIGEHLSFKVPQTILLSNQQLFFQHPKGEAKLLQYIDGNFIAKAPQTKELLFSLGAKIAELTIALQKIKSSILSSRILFWDIQHAALSYPKTTFIEEPERRKLITYFFDRFQHIVLPEQPFLRNGIIHGDLNDYNILVKDGAIEGFLDFGDSSFAPIVYDLAIAMTYLMLNKEDPIEEILPLLKGFHSVHQLTQKEVELLPDLVTTRLCISVCNSAEKKQLHQDNEYLLISEKPAWALLEKWITINPVKMVNAFLKATGYLPIEKDNNKKNLLKTRDLTTGKSVGLSYKDPILMTRAAFQYMYDTTGNTYLDVYNNIAHVGHSHPKISAALSKQVRHLNTNTRYLFESFTNYTSNLLKRFPEKLSKIFLVNSGSEASDLAIRMARIHTKRNRIAVLENGYHGNTSLGIEISSYKFDGKGGNGVSSSVLKLPLPNLYNGIFNTGMEYAKDAKEKIQKSIEKNNLPAAFIAEPISGCGGQVPLAEGYLKELNVYISSNQLLTIIDETQTGFGRLGNWYWGFEMHDIIPDIVILGKPMGNGHPMAAVITTDAIANSFNNGMEFFSSFGGNPVSCEVGSAVLSIIEEEKLQANAFLVGNYFKKRLSELKNLFSSIGDIRGEGLFLGIEFTGTDGKPDTTLAEFVKEELKNNFILIGTDGPYNNVIKIKPPLCFTTNNADEFIHKLEKTLQRKSFHK